MKQIQTWTDYRQAIDDWPLRHFTPCELATAGSPAKPDHLLTVHWPSALALDALRANLDHPLKVSSAYRSPAHNVAVGGAGRSMHLEGRAFDVWRETLRDETRFLCEAWRLGFKGFGFYDRFIHIDTGAKRYWDERSDKGTPVPVPWELPGVIDDGNVPADIRAIAAPPPPFRRPESARASTHTGTGLGAAGGAAVFFEAERVAEYVQGRGDAPVFALLAAAVTLCAFGFVVWRLVKGRRAQQW